MIREVLFSFFFANLFLFFRKLLGQSLFLFHGFEVFGSDVAPSSLLLFFLLSAELLHLDLKTYKFRAIMRHLIERKQERECAFEPVTPFVFAEIPMLQLVLLLELQLLVEPWQISDQYPACAK